MSRKIELQLEAVFRLADGTEVTFLCMTGRSGDGGDYLTHCLFRSASGERVPVAIRREAFLDLSPLGRHQSSRDRSEEIALEELARRTGGELVAIVREYEVELDGDGLSRVVVSLRRENGPQSWRGWVSGPFHYANISDGETPRAGMLDAVPAGERLEAERIAIQILDAGLSRYGARRTGRPV